MDDLVMLQFQEIEVLLYLLQWDIQLAHGSQGAGPLGHKHMLDGGAALHSGVHSGLQVYDFSPSNSLVTGYHNLTLSCRDNWSKRAEEMWNWSVLMVHVVPINNSGSVQKRRSPKLQNETLLQQ